MITESKPILIAIDDERFYLDEIGYEVEGHNVEYQPYLGPSDFEERIQENDINRAKLILIDYDFKKTTAIDCDIANFIRSMYPSFSGKIVLVSLMNDFFSDNKAVKKSFDEIINKGEFTWEGIAPYFY